MFSFPPFGRGSVFTAAKVVSGIQLVSPSFSHDVDAVAASTRDFHFRLALHRCDVVIFRQRCRNIGRLDLRLSFGKLPTAKVAVLWAIFRHTAEIYDGKTEAIFRQLPTDLFA